LFLQLNRIILSIFPYLLELPHYTQRLFSCCVIHLDIHYFPTRRSSDLEVMEQRNWHRQTCVHNTVTLNNKNLDQTESVTKLWQPDRKSTRLNSSHVSNSYAVFCLKKKHNK